MTTIISLVTINYHTELQNIFFLVMRTLKIYSLGKFQICTTMLVTIVPMLQSSIMNCSYLTKVGFMATLCPGFSYPLQCGPSCIHPVCRSQPATF